MCVSCCVGFIQTCEEKMSTYVSCATLFGFFVRVIIATALVTVAYNPHFSLVDAWCLYSSYGVVGRLTTVLLTLIALFTLGVVAYRFYREKHHVWNLFLPLSLLVLLAVGIGIVGTPLPMPYAYLVVCVSGLFLGTWSYGFELRARMEAYVRR